MEVQAAAALGMAFVAGLSALGSAIGDAIACGKAIEGVARQPEARGNIMTLMFISVGLIESIPIIGIVIAFILMGQL
jgi:F-type H+-transporting ATPase subunit c